MSGGFMVGRFRQAMSATPSDIQWARIDSTLWNLAFTGQAKAQRCRYCFSLAHSASECDWAPAVPTRASDPGWVSKNAKVCLSWNHSFGDTCSYGAGCKFMHVCSFCVKDSSVVNRNHKANFCVRLKTNKRPGAGSSGSFVPRYHPYYNIMMG